MLNDIFAMGCAASYARAERQGDSPRDQRVRDCAYVGGGARQLVVPRDDQRIARKRLVEVGVIHRPHGGETRCSWTRALGDRAYRNKRRSKRRPM
jgi:hypothetical protein